MTAPKASTPSAGLGPATPFGVAAEVVLSRRLRAVNQAIERLRDASRDGAVEPEAIHQVRVSVRRASAAIRVFEPCLTPGRAVTKAKARLKRLRRSIGAARTLDVSIALLAHDRKASGGEARHALAILESFARGLRRDARRDVDRALARAGPARLSRTRRRLLDALDTDSPAANETLHHAAARALDALVREAFAPGDAGLRDAPSLHAMRLAMKRLRYATEIFGPCFDADRLDRTSALLADVQDRLGAANDLFEIVRLIDARRQASGGGPMDDTLRFEYARRLEEARASFESWWRAEGRRALASCYAPFLSPRDTAEPLRAVVVPSSRAAIGSMTPGTLGSGM